MPPVHNPLEHRRKERLRIFLQQPSIGCKNPTPEALERYGNALTHPSYIQDHPRKEGASPGTEDYERLEFLGDRVLNLVVAEYLFSDGHQSEGSMTSRMEVVKNQHLGAIVPSLCIGFPEMIQLGRNQERTTRIIAASFEAFMGAYYLDGGLNATRDLIMRLMGDEISSFSPGDNYKKMLQEEVQRYPGILPVYVLREKEGPDHRPVFTYAVLLGGKVYGEGRGHSKARATQNAALAALRALGHSPPGDSESPADSL